MLASAGGCSTLSSFGLPLTGPHKLITATNDMRSAAGRPVDLPSELSKQVLSEYVVDPGDVLVIEPADFNSAVRFGNGDQTVTPDGSIDLGKYGRIPVAGNNLAEIQSQIQAVVEEREEKYPGRILVRLLGWESKVYYVLGEVNSPGAYPFNGRETVLDAIVAAGDLTDRANRHKIIFSRPSVQGDCRTVLPICYNQIVQLGDTSTNYQILPGDRVFVSSMAIWDDIGQTLFPRHHNGCPRCGTRQVPCFVARCGKDNNCARSKRREYCKQIEKRGQKTTALRDKVSD